jgi:hypothetical protein
MNQTNKLSSIIYAIVHECVDLETLLKDIIDQPRSALEQMNKSDDQRMYPHFVESKRRV